MEYTKDQSEFLSHLLTRMGMGQTYHVVTLNSFIDLEKQLCSFKLWNLSGQFVGFQQYNYKGSKQDNNKQEGKYWTILPSKLGFYGLEYLNYSLPYLFITEGIFDAISILPYGNAIAVLSNNPKHLSEQLMLLPFEKIAVCDGDDSGEEIAKFADKVIVCPKGEDANSLMMKNRLTYLLGDYRIERNLFEKRLKWIKAIK